MPELETIRYRTEDGVAWMTGIAYAAAYAASKGGVLALSRVLAAELGPRGVGVNCVRPGGVDTPMVEQFRPPAGAPQPAGREAGRRPLAPPSDIAAAIAFLASDDAASTNGAILVVNAGATAS